MKTAFHFFFALACGLVLPKPENSSSKRIGPLGARLGRSGTGSSRCSGASLLRLGADANGVADFDAKGGATPEADCGAADARGKATPENTPTPDGVASG